MSGLRKIHKNLITIFVLLFIASVFALVAPLLEHYVVSRLGDWTMAYYQKFLVLHITNFDRALVRLFPLAIAIYIAQGGKPKIIEYLKVLFVFSSSLLVFLLIGLLVAIMTWSNFLAPSPLLPYYLKYQPFEFYWSLFILTSFLMSYIVIRVLLKPGRAEVSK